MTSSGSDADEGLEKFWLSTQGLNPGPTSQHIQCRDHSPVWNTHIYGIETEAGKYINH